LPAAIGAEHVLTKPADMIRFAHDFWKQYKGIKRAFDPHNLLNPGVTLAHEEDPT
jgi:FAD/FMN-containing dehydrogenase